MADDRDRQEKDWNRVEHRHNVQLVDTADLLTREELRELKALASYAKALRWIVAGFMAAAGFLGLDRISAWLKH